MSDSRHYRWSIILLFAGALAAGCGTSNRGSGSNSTPRPYQIDLSGVQVVPLEEAPANTIGLCFCLDVSPSMNEQIDGQTKSAISKQAMRQTFAQLATFAQEHPEKQILVGLVVFGGEARLVQKLEPFDQQKLEHAIRSLPELPSTGVGNGMLLGLSEIVKTPLETRALVVMTDGESNTGIDPGRVVKAIKSNANSQQTPTDDLQISLVAFDVNASAFSAVKQAGATVVESRDQKSLEGMLQAIVAEVLLEAPSSK